ncbi:hypothetical protein [uncultured Gilvimarinus sp.]|uniref:hypothetical protein n=1 Tax=uncultured Gilvimarinus sp. TaxID=1689143 RepID=UPI0030EC8321
MKSLIVIIALLLSCWFMTDVRSDNSLFNVIAPLGVVVFSIALAIWVAFALAARRSDGNQPSPGPDFFDGSGGSDGGGD